MWIQFLGGEDPRSLLKEREMATHSSILARTIPLDKRAFEGYSPWGWKESDDNLATKQNSNNIYNPSVCLPEWQVLQRKWMRWILFLTSQSPDITFNVTLFLNKGSGSCSSSWKATFNEAFETHEISYTSSEWKGWGTPKHAFNQCIWALWKFPVCMFGDKSLTCN